MNGDGKDRPIGTVRFHPGDGVAVVGDRVVVLVLDAPTSALVQGLRSRLVGPVGADVALDAMVRAGGLDLPPFGLVAFEGSRARVVVRGSVRALVEASDDQFEVGGELVSTWVERVADGVQSVELTIAGAADRSGSGFEVDGGIDATTVGRARDLGADTFVAGNAIFGRPDRAAAIAEIRNALG